MKSRNLQVTQNFLEGFPVIQTLNSLYCCGLALIAELIHREKLLKNVSVCLHHDQVTS